MANESGPMPAGLEIRGPMQPGYETVLTPAALEFVADLTRRFGDRVADAAGRARDAPEATSTTACCPISLPRRAEVREAQWRVTRIPGDLQDRRVEITGPTDRKMIINALNSGAKVFMADFEDSLTPTWDNVVQGQINLRDAVRRTIELHESRRQAVPPQPADRDAARAPARLASRREARAASTASRCPARSSTSACTSSTTTRR